MKHTISLLLSLSLIACSGKTGKEEKEIATQEFINCNFQSAKQNAQLAIDYADGNVEIAVPALLILGKSSEFLGEKSDAFEKIVELAPGVQTASDAKKIANNFVKQLSIKAPEKVKACPQLQS